MYREGNISTNLGAQFVGRSGLLVLRSPKLPMQGDPSYTANKSAIVYGTVATRRVTFCGYDTNSFSPSIAPLREIPGK